MANQDNYLNRLLKKLKKQHIPTLDELKKENDELVEKEKAFKKKFSKR
jgi:hypothetical protein